MLKGCINRVKVDTAKHLILSGNKIVKEVAKSVGFEEVYYFCRVFKELEGISPGAYARSGLVK